MTKRKSKADDKIGTKSVSLLESSVTKKVRWTNKERVLIFSSRGIPYRARHLLLDLLKLMAHSKKESKMNRKDRLPAVNEICEIKNCSKCIFVECRKKNDNYMWISNIPNGPSCKFLMENVHTLQELKLTGNCLARSRPILSFDATFDSTSYYKIMKELFIQVFGTPHGHPKSQPFFDRVLTFSVDSSRVFVRHFQIVQDGDTLSEIGPRFVLNPIRIFSGSFRGEILWGNPFYKSPNLFRRERRLALSVKYTNRLEAKKGRIQPEQPYKLDPLDDVFLTAPPLTAT